MEQRDDPSLRGRPVVVGGSPHSRGVVCAASYEARAFGVRSAMPCIQAFRRCPQAVFVAPDFTRYAAASRAVMACCRAEARAIEPLSLDEAFLDLGDGDASPERIRERVQGLRTAIRDATGLTASAGAAQAKFLAKAASDACKPDGLRVIAPADAPAVAASLAIGALPGVGRVLGERLRLRGIQRAGDLLTLDPRRLRELAGAHGAILAAFAAGIDGRGVVDDHGRQSIGIEDTFDRDCDDPADLLRRLDRLVTGLVERLRRAHQRTRCLTLKVKWADFRLTTRSHSRHDPWDAGDLGEVAARLLDEALADERPVRLLGLAASHLEDADGATQQTLFAA